MASRLNARGWVASADFQAADAGYKGSDQALQRAGLYGGNGLGPHLTAGGGWSGRQDDAGGRGDTRFFSLSGSVGAAPWTLGWWAADQFDPEAPAHTNIEQVRAYVSLPLGVRARLEQALQLETTNDRLKGSRTAGVAYQASFSPVIGGRLNVSMQWRRPLAGDTPSRAQLGLGWRGQVNEALQLDLFTRLPEVSQPSLNLGGAITYRLSQGQALEFGFEWPQTTTGVAPKIQAAYRSSFDLPLFPRPDVGHIKGRVVDGAGRGIADLVVQIGTLAVTTDPDGRFEFPAVPPGEGFLVNRADQLGPSRVTQPATPWHFVLDPRQTLTQTFYAHQAAHLAGQLVLQTPAQSALSSGFVSGQPGAQPLAGVRIQLRGADGRLLQQVADEAGRFAFENLAPGDWVLEVDDADLPPAYDVQPKQQTLHLAEGESRAVDIQMVPIARRIQMMQGGTVEVGGGGL